MATPLHGSVRMDVDADLSAVPDGARSLEQAVRGAVNTLGAGLGEAAAGRKYLEKVEAWARGANYTAKRLPALPAPICKAGQRLPASPPVLREARDAFTAADPGGTGLPAAPHRGHTMTPCRGWWRNCASRRGCGRPSA